jgi:hypothetical protein
MSAVTYNVISLNVVTPHVIYRRELSFVNILEAVSEGDAKVGWRFMFFYFFVRTGFDRQVQIHARTQPAKVRLSRPLGTVAVI